MPTIPTIPLVSTPRRGLLKGAGVLSAGTLLMLAGRSSRAQSASSTEADVNILNVALTLEHEAISAYQLGAASGLLQKPVLDVAVRFQADHKAHRDALVATIRKLGGKPAEEMKLEQYAASLNAASLKNQADVLGLAAKLELGATNAYLSVIPSFRDGQLAKVAARLAADETFHWTLLNNALGRPLPAGALSFGA